MTVRALLAALALVASPAAAQQAVAQPAGEPPVRALFQNVTRVEGWSFFDAPDPDADSNYTLASNRARLAIRVDAPRLSIEGSFQYAQIIGLPMNAIGPGPLGPGASYFAAARTPEAYQLYLRSLSLTLHDFVPRLSLRVGRLDYASGADTPFAGRLIGGAEWTAFERAFDGVRVDYSGRDWRAQAAFLMPTQGAFEESASPTIGQLQLTSATWRRRAVEVFGHNYRDRRSVRARPDNTGIAAHQIDIDVQTYGASFAGKRLQLWGAWQRGHWYGDSHRAFSVSSDVGHDWTTSPWRPSLRAGGLYASGDDDPNDQTHGTFFPMIPTTGPQLLRGTFAQMNLRDLYVSLSLQPRERIRVDAEIHYLSLAHRQDRWYSGTGATAFRGDYFGFSSRRSTLRSILGTYAQASLARRMTSHWALSAAAGVMHGGDVIRRQFAGRTLFVLAVDSVVSLP